MERVIIPYRPPKPRHSTWNNYVARPERYKQRSCHYERWVQYYWSDINHLCDKMMSVDSMNLDEPEIFWAFIVFLYENSSGYIPDY